MVKFSPSIFTRLRKMYAEEGGPAPEPVLNMTWNYSTPHELASEEVAMESNGKALADITDPATERGDRQERPTAELLCAAAR